MTPTQLCEVVRSLAHFFLDPTRLTPQACLPQPGAVALEGCKLDLSGHARYDERETHKVENCQENSASLYGSAFARAIDVDDAIDKIAMLVMTAMLMLCL